VLHGWALHGTALHGNERHGTAQHSLHGTVEGTALCTARHCTARHSSLHCCRSAKWWNSGTEPGRGLDTVWELLDSCQGLQVEAVEAEGEVVEGEVVDVAGPEEEQQGNGVEEEHEGPHGPPSRCSAVQCSAVQCSEPPPGPMPRSGRPS
jgi:hypothetical protein